MLASRTQKAPPYLQQDPAPQFSACWSLSIALTITPGLLCPLWLHQSHLTTSATALMTAAAECNESLHTCTAPESSWQAPSPHQSSCIHPLPWWRLSPKQSTITTPDLQPLLSTLLRCNWEARYSTYCHPTPRNSSFVVSHLAITTTHRTAILFSVLFSEVSPHWLALSASQLH